VQIEPDFKAGKKALDAQDWNGAIAAFVTPAARVRGKAVAQCVGQSFTDD
jgi:hypothetical protein